jgi:exopolyphosphatase/guanosine-5'-triphosphate,3'-diphosphate pyrophosphatase
VDVGTNSVRSLVALVGESGDVLPLIRRAKVTQLGAGLALGGPLEPAARRRTGEAVASLIAEAKALGARTIQLVGTSAARDAADGPAFIEELGRELGVSARVATGPEEAALSFLGATRDLGGDPVVMDIGGGSTELVRGGGAGADRSEVDAVSLDLGCVRGTVAWFAGDPPSSEERRAARRLCVEAFRPLAGRFGPGAEGRSEATAERAAGRADAHAGAAAGADGVTATDAERPLRLVGVAGTITTLACLALSLPEYDPDAIHLRTFGRRDLELVVDRLAAMGPDERAALPCMQQGRTGVIVAGGEILLGAMEALGWVEITVSERDILDGILQAGAGAGIG